MEEYFKIKFTFHLKNGKVFETYQSLTGTQFKNAAEGIRLSMRDDKSGEIHFYDCMIRLSECAVVEWEVLDEQEAEKS